MFGLYGNVFVFLETYSFKVVCVWCWIFIWKRKEKKNLVTYRYSLKNIMHGNFRNCTADTITVAVVIFKKKWDKGYSLSKNKKLNKYIVSKRLD